MNSTDTLIKIFGLATIAFGTALVLTPLLTNFLYKYKLGKQIRDDGTTPVFSRLHATKGGTPSMGGVLVAVARDVTRTESPRRIGCYGRSVVGGALWLRKGWTCRRGNTSSSVLVSGNM